LEPLSVEEIESFDKHFVQFSRQAYTWDLWGAAFIINGGCSDDGFQYFRWWLISRGRDWFYRALREPNTPAISIRKERNLRKSPTWQTGSVRRNLETFQPMRCRRILRNSPGNRG
jgi:hypothetical protein